MTFLVVIVEVDDRSNNGDVLYEENQCMCFSSCIFPYGSDPATVLFVTNMR